MDTSAEKAGCYLQPSETDSGSYLSGTTNLGTEFPENASLIDSLSNLHGIGSRESQCNRTTKWYIIIASLYILWAKILKTLLNILQFSLTTFENEIL